MATGGDSEIRGIYETRDPETVSVEASAESAADDLMPEDEAIEADVTETVAGEAEITFEMDAVEVEDSEDVEDTEEVPPADAEEETS